MKDVGTVAVIGLGYVGLPLAEAAVGAGWQVWGFDTSSSVVEGLMLGKSAITDVSDATVRSMLASGFTATSDQRVLTKADVIVICVPTPLSEDGGPDLRAVKAAAQAVASHLHRGQLIVLESTTYPGTSEELLIPILETSGLTAGKDFGVAFSPERIDPGNKQFGIRNTPKVVGGYSPACTQLAVDFYSTICQQVVVARGLREAEMTKLLENTYRHVNIALVNEMARFSHSLGIDLWDAIRCASTKPFGYQAFEPGPGVGGHCIPIDPNYLSHRVRTHVGQPFRFVELAQEINSGMPAYVVRRAQDLLNSRAKALRGSRVLLIGVTYKRDVADQRESPALEVAQRLLDLGAVVDYSDPFVSEWVVGDREVQRQEDLSRALSRCDIAIVLQHHSSLDLGALRRTSTPVLDTRGALDGPHVEKL